MLRNKLGFTLIELMIVVAIIGILAVVATPKFSDLIDKSKEGRTKGYLASIRGALQVYYAEKEGTYPTGSLVKALVPYYIKEIPECNLPSTGHTPTKSIMQVLISDLPEVYSGGFTLAGQDNNMWAYCEYKDGLTGAFGNKERNWGDFWISSTQKDLYNRDWSLF